MLVLRTLIQFGLGISLILAIFSPPMVQAAVVDTGQANCYDAAGAIPCPRAGEPYYGQDAQYMGATPAYRNNGDGTISDINTGLMWSKAVDLRKVTPAEAKRLARQLTLGGHQDWRVPTIKELYTLIDFRGYTGSARPGTSTVPADAVPFINTDYFDFAYGNGAGGERYIDAQWLSSTRYVADTMDGMETAFGVNFADGRIKGYGFRRLGSNRVTKTFFVRFVRGNTYGDNQLADNGDGTVSDRSSGLMWMQADSGRAMNWQQALAYAENLIYAGHDDWRLPNAKELQALVDYRRSPDTSRSPAIAPIFETTAIVNEAGKSDYPFFWTSTTHLDGPRPGADAAYIAFGRAIGQMHGRVMDVHGAGAQRGDPKVGNAAIGHGPQGDARRSANFVRCVRSGGVATGAASTKSADRSRYPYRIRLVEQKNDVTFRSRPPKGPGSRGAMPRGGFVRRLDRDGDGKVSRAEFDGPPGRFDDHDRNDDGYLSEAEAPPMPPPGLMY